MEEHAPAAPKPFFSLPPRLRWVLTLLMTLAAVAIFAQVIYSNRELLASFEWQVRPLPLAASFVSYALYYGLAAFIWGSMVRGMGSSARWTQHFRIYYISVLANRMPLPFGHIASRLALYDERTNKRMLSFASALELLLIAITGACVALFFWMGAFDLRGGLIGLLVLALGLFFVHPAVLNRILALLRLQSGQTLTYRQTLAWFPLYLLVWVLGGCVLYFLIAAVYPIPLSLLPRVIGAWTVSGLVGILMVFLPVGLGVRELTLGVVLATLIPPGIAAVIAILTRLALTFFELILAALASLLPEK